MVFLKRTVTFPVSIGNIFFSRRTPVKNIMKSACSHSTVSFSVFFSAVALFVAIELFQPKAALRFVRLSHLLRSTRLIRVKRILSEQAGRGKMGLP